MPSRSPRPSRSSSRSSSGAAPPPAAHPSGPAGPVPRVGATLDALYYGFYVDGLRRRYGRARWMRPPFAAHKPGMAVVVGDRRVFIDAEDDPTIDPEALAWCDVYGKVHARAPLPPKVVAIGPSFGVTAWSWSRVPTAVAGAEVHGTQRALRTTVADFVRQVRARRPERTLTPVTSDPDRVFFAATLWRKEPATNRARANFVAACRGHPRIVFEGGFAPRTDGWDPGLGTVLLDAPLPYDAYLAATARSAFVFNTPAVTGCPGWKLGEYLALGKAIITTPLRIELPAPLEPGRHVHLCDGSVASILEAIDALGDDAYRRSLEREARAYYDRHLAPEAVIGRLTAG